MVYSREFFEQMMDENSGNLDISSTKITRFPNKMVVLGSLNIKNTSLKTIPNDMYIIGDIITDDEIIRY